MRTHSTKKTIKFFTVFVLITASGLFGDAFAYPAHTLLIGKWSLISLPADPGSEGTIENLFGDDLPADGENYGSTWLLYELNASIGEYEIVPINEPLKPHTGYWIVQNVEDSIELDIPDSLAPLTGSVIEACIEGKNCTAHSLDSGDGIVWNLVGYSSDTAHRYGESRFLSSGDSCAIGCSPEEALQANVAYNMLYKFNSANEAFEAVDESTVMQPWDGYWLAVLPGAENATWVLPTGDLDSPDVPGNVAPVAVNDSVGPVDVGGDVTFSVLDNDTDDDGDLIASTVTIVDEPGSGKATVAADGQITYSHDGSAVTNSDAFTYTVQDDAGAISNVATVTVTPINDPEPQNIAPIAVDDTAGPLDAGATITFAVIDNDTDNDGNIVASTVDIIESPSAGTATVDDDGMITYTHDGAQGTRSDTLTYIVQDDVGAVSNAATVTITPIIDNDIDFDIGYSIALQAPNGTRVPKIVGASGDKQLLTGYDYFDWYGITEHRTWFKPSFSNLPNNSTVRTAEDFTAATEAIRRDPLRQATSSDFYIDWDFFNREVANDEVVEQVEHLRARDIMPMIINTNNVGDDIGDSWEKKFTYWKQWYTKVYFLASRYDVTLYQMRNEPHHGGADYSAWETHWITSADAMRKAIDDVNRDFNKSLEVNLAGPVSPGVYWDYSLPHPDIDFHSWGNHSWNKVKFDVFGNYDANNPWNYNSYDYHRYGLPASNTQNIVVNGRTSVQGATNDPRPDIPMIISEFNTSTGGSFDRSEKDTEDLVHGVSMAAILQSISVHGEDGLGDDGGFFIFKLGASQSRDELPLVGLGNKLSYVSREEPKNYGGITRGGATFQMFARHFRDGKPLVPVSTLSEETNGHRTMAAFDEEKGMYYIYGSTTEGADTGISIDVSALDVAFGDTATLQRVDEFNTGQITELLTVSSSIDLSFYSPNNTAFLIKLPVAGSLSAKLELAPTDDTTQAVSREDSQGNSSTMNVSMHHSDVNQREAALIRFTGEYDNSKQALLKITGRNVGDDRSEREILHVYAVDNEEWNEGASRAWTDTPGLGKYYSSDGSMSATDGTGDMIDIEDNYSGFSSGAGKGLGITGEFVGAVSFHSSDYVDNYLDVTDYLNSISSDDTALDVTFVVVRIVRYNVNEYTNSYYTRGEYHYDGRQVEIASKEHANEALSPSLLISQ